MPPLTLENAAALVPGGGAQANKENDMQQQKAAQQNQMQEVRVLRAFYYQGKPIEKDSVVKLPKLFAVEMRAANKVEFVEPAPAAPAPAPKAAEKAPEQKPAKKGD